ncbi:MAG: efflux transporter periplasmic adaptor subunit [Burkholderiales bacterium PBB6]|nr:MAG: efflux transporter periplasmic adaptor subunit [Burkholderiales bacterium PBB6]
MWMAVGAATSAAPAQAAETSPTAVPVRVPVLVVKQRGTAAGVSLDGAVQARRQATVAAQVGGNVLALLVKAGDRVKAGQPLARLDDRDANAGLQRTDAGVAQAEAELRNARLAAERQRELRSKGFVSQAAVDTAETQLKAAQAGLAQASGARSQAALARGFATLVAPFDGVVLATHLDAGDLASPGRPVLTLYAPGALRAVVQVPASQAAQARAARQVQVQLPDGQWVTPTAVQALPVTDPISQTVEWRLDLAAATDTLSPGQSLRVRFDDPAPDAATSTAPLTVPQAAVLRRGELDAVYVQREQRFVLRAVRLGRQQGTDRVEVLAGLKPGERIATDAVRAGLAGALPGGEP